MFFNENMQGKYRILKQNKSYVAFNFCFTNTNDQNPALLQIMKQNAPIYLTTQHIFIKKIVTMPKTGSVLFSHALHAKMKILSSVHKTYCPFNISYLVMHSSNSSKIISSQINNT